MTPFLIKESLSAPRVFTECYRDRPEMDLHQFRKQQRGCRVFVMVLGGKTIGAISCKNGYFHLGVLPPFRRIWATKGRLKYISDWANSHGFYRTKAKTGSFGERMVKAAGMIPTQALEGGSDYAYAT